MKHNYIIYLEKIIFIYRFLVDKFYMQTGSDLTAVKIIAWDIISLSDYQQYLKKNKDVSE